eukprot:1185137-Prorocentrum_minimum.AAC.1
MRRRTIAAKLVQTRGQGEGESGVCRYHRTSSNSPSAKGSWSKGAFSTTPDASRSAHRSSRGKLTASTPCANNASLSTQRMKMDPSLQARRGLLDIGGLEGV